MIDHDAYSDAYIQDILLNTKTVAMVGASANIARPSYFVLKYLLQKGYQVSPVNPRYAGKEILDQACYETLQDIPHQIDMVDIFRGSNAALAITREAIKIGAKYIWMQLEVRNDEAAKLAEEAGLKVVMNRCPKIEFARLSGEIGWAGINSGQISSAKPKLAAKGFQSFVLNKK